MPPSRFSQVSRYRNATLTVSKADARYSELGLSVPAAASSSAEHSSAKKVAVAPHSGHVLAKTSASPGSFAVLAEAGFGKFAKRPPGIDVGVHVVDFDVGAFQGNNSDDDDDFVLATVASGSTGEVIVDRIVGLPKGTQEGKLEVKNMKRFRADEDVGMVRFCPAVDGVLATASPSHGTVRIWDVEQGTCVAKLDNGSAGLWSFDWSTDGRTLATASKDGQLRLWDLASGQCQCTASFAPHHASKLKPTRVAFVSVQSAHLLVTTGFGAMRQREVAVWDTRDVAEARKRTSLDVSTAPLEPYVERDRGLVYLVSRGDSSMRWIDVGSTDQGGPNTFAEGHFSLLDVAPTGSAAVCAPSRYDTTCGEVARLVVCSYSSTGSAASSDSVVPVSVRVPRRQYIDFHQDLYPETVWRGPGSGKRNAGTSWVDGIGKPLATLSLDPATRSKDEASLATTAKDPAPLFAAPSATTSNDSSTAGVAAPTNPSGAKQPEATAVAAIAAPATGPSLDYKVPPVAKPALGTTEATAAAAAAAPAVPAATSVIRPPKMQQDEKPTASSQQWSRRFLAGGTPLVPAYQNLTAVDVSRSADARMLAASPKYFFVPISGPGGRLAIFPLSKTGRVPVHLPCFVHGAALGDFATNPFDDAMVYTSAADGNLRAWKVPSTVDKDEKEQTEGGITVEKPERTVKLPGSATRVLQLAVHPNVKGLVAVVVASSDHIGSPLIYLVDFEGERIISSVKSTEELVATAGLFGAGWSPDGSVLALAGKDRKLYLIDVRVPDGQIRVFGQAPAHDSPRSFRIVWLDGNHIVTVGHGPGSSRQLKLFAIDFLSSASLSEVSRCPLDVSPALLFPHWDADTCILYLWSKGERIVHAYEIHPDQQQQQQQQRSDRAGLAVAAGQQQTWLQLPQFQHGEAQLGLDWLGKDSVDVKTVEVATSIRLCRTEAQRVGWKITRSRPEFFQDDVFPPTRLQRQPLLSTAEWLRGDDGGVNGSGLHPRVSIKPDGMTPLSQAPPASLRQSKLPKGPISREKTAEEREQEALDEVFERAKKNDEGAKDIFDSEGARRAPDDDDWGDSD